LHRLALIKLAQIRMIYTKTGDKGTTMLGNGKRVFKSDLRVECYGTIDELNASIGLIVAEIQNSKFLPRRQAGKIQNYNSRLPKPGTGGQAKFKNNLINIQEDLFEIGANLANPQQKNTKKLDQYLKKRVEDFEKEIDLISEKLPSLTHFIIPGGGSIGATLHLARTVCRRAERRIVELGKKEAIQDQMIIYLNRLSDLLFVMARLANLKEKKKEVVWFKK